MTTFKNAEKCLWMCVVILVTYLFVGSFIASKNFYDLMYLFILYAFLIIVRVYEKKDRIEP